ncbi:MAG: isoprenylcysteine carboxylmethyltransferase family protein, partial [Mycobacterium sp.]
MKTVAKGMVSAVLGLLAFGLMLFLPAGTFHYWQAWLFLAVFALVTWIPSVYLIRTNPAALERRMRPGPFAETRMVQKVIISVVFVAFMAMFAVSALDHRF